MPYLCTGQRTFKVAPNPDDQSESMSETKDTEQQARVTVKQWIDAAFSNHSNTESMQVEVTKFD